MQSDFQKFWQILRNWVCWRQMLHFDKRWLISLWYRQKPCIVGSIEMMVQQDRKGLWAWLLMLFIVLLEERRIINGYQRCTFDNEITLTFQRQKQQHASFFASNFHWWKQMQPPLVISGKWENPFVLKKTLKIQKCTPFVCSACEVSMFEDLRKKCGLFFAKIYITMY